MVGGKAKRAWLILLLVAAAVVSSFHFMRSRPAEMRKRSPLGEFELLEVTVHGQVFREGSWFQRTFEKVLPLGGVKVGDLQFRKPIHHRDRNEAPMTAWLLYRGSNIRPGSTPPLFGARVIVENALGKEFENPVPSVRGSGSNEMLISIPIVAFPGDEDHFVLGFSPPVSGGTNREWVKFKIKNPRPLTALTWSSPLPQTNQVNGEIIVLREVNLQPASCEFELPTANWSVDECVMVNGNGERFTPTRRQEVKSAKSVYRCGFNHRLETTQSWRIELTLVNPVDLEPAQCRMVHLSAQPTPQTITNQAGNVFGCAFDGHSLSITAPPEESLPRLGWIITGATNAASGEPLTIRRFAPMAGQPVSQVWPPLETPCGNIVLRLCYPKTLRTQFDLKAADPPGPKARKEK